MNNAPETTPVYVKCQRCGTQIPEQSAIEEDGLLLCGECLVADVKRDVSKAEIEAEQQRHHEHKEQRAQNRKEQRRRALLFLSVCVAVLISALVFTQMNKAEPVPTQHLNGVDNPAIVRSMLLLGIYKYQNEHGGTPPKTLKDLVPKYLNAELSESFELFNYELAEDKSYSLKLKKGIKSAAQQPHREEIQGDKL